MLLFSISTVFAGNNETVSDIVGATDNLDDVVQIQDIPDTQSSKSDEQILTAGNNVINVVNVMDSYRVLQSRFMTPQIMWCQLLKLIQRVMQLLKT